MRLTPLHQQARTRLARRGALIPRNLGRGERGGPPDILWNNSAPAPAATVGVPYSWQVPHSGGYPMTWTKSGNLPAGLTLNAATGLVSGTASATMAPGSVFVTATNEWGNEMVDIRFSAVDPPPFSLDLDADGKPDTFVGRVGSVVVTRDADSVNIDVNDDGHSDLQVIS
jgi:hypothetical protein